MNAIAIVIDTGVSEMIKSPCCGTKVEYKFYECSIMRKVIDTYVEKILWFELQKERLVRMRMEEAEQLRLFKPLENQRR